jgi:hypothetical protein
MPVLLWNCVPIRCWAVPLPLEPQLNSGFAALVKCPGQYTLVAMVWCTAPTSSV